MAIVPVRAPVAEGVNVTEMAHDAPPASAAPQLLVWANSPEGTILAIESPVDALFRRVTASAALVAPNAVAGKVMLAGVIVVGTTAVPASLTVCGLFGAL